VAKEKKYVIKNFEKEICIWVGKKEALVNDKKIVIEAKPLSNSGQIFVPLRFIYEKLGAEVTWYPKEFKVQITY
jgi:N-acetylmuramoyl-L-alanine amidase